MVRKTKTVSETEVTEITVNVTDIKSQRDKLIEQIKGLLLTKSQVKRGGPEIRSRYEAEKGYQANIDDINELGRQIGEGDVSLGSLRAE